MGRESRYPERIILEAHGFRFNALANGPADGEVVPLLPWLSFCRCVAGCHAGRCTQIDDPRADGFLGYIRRHSPFTTLPAAAPALLLPLSAGPLGDAGLALGGFSL